MANTYTLISSYAATGTVASIDFTSIPATYTDLQVLFTIRLNDSSSASNFRMRVNSSTSGYSNRRVYGTGSSANSDNQPDTGTYYGAAIASGSTSLANTFANISVYIPNYASSNYKSISVDGVQDNNVTEGYAVLSAGLWSNTAAITSITLLNGDHNILQYSTAYLYGIKNS